MRLGIYGGSFDPVHFGHLLLAESCRETCRLDRVWFIPAAVSPHKRNVPPADSKHRVEMLRLAVAGHEAFEVSLIEIERGGVSFTVETVARVAEQNPGAELFLLMGADTLVEFPSWREPQRICELAMPVVVRRPGSPEPAWEALRPLVSAERAAEIKNHVVEMPLIGHSSSEMRERIAAHRSIRYRTPRAVEKYIETHGLYTERGN